MGQTSPSRILVCAANVAHLGELRRLLEAHGHDVTAHLLGSPDPADFSGLHLVLIDGAGRVASAIDFCRRIHPRLDESFLPVLFVTDEVGPQVRLAIFEAGAHAYLLRPFIPGEVIAQTAALLRIKETHTRLADRTAEIHRINRRLQQAYQQIDQELELAQRIQAGLLPQTLPQVPHVRFAVHYLLCGRVGGDFYDIFRLDERHVGFYVADAMGHGVPASLLTIFVKKGIRPKEVFGSQYRLLPPDEVLARLNRELIDQHLTEQPFITMVYALFDHVNGTIQFARAGHPYPLYVPRSGELQFWKREGLLLGIADAHFPCSTYPLAPGDKLLFYSDGVDHATFEDCEPGASSLLACAEKYRDLPAQDFVAKLARELFGTAAQPDDLTLLGVERCEG